MLGGWLGICNNFDLQHVVIPPGRVSAVEMVACNSELLLLQQRNGTADVTLGRWETVAGSRGIGGCGKLGSAGVDWQWADGAAADESGRTRRGAGGDGGARGELLAGGGDDSHPDDVDGEEGYRWSWAAHLAGHGGET